MKALSIHIATPCHEDWQQMTPVDKGRFCQSCAKQVVDFSVMTDQQILNYISNASGSMCGRFADDQLQRPLQPVQHSTKKVWWIAAIMPLLLLFEKGNAQKKKHTPGVKKVNFNREYISILGNLSINEVRPVIQIKVAAAYGIIVNAAGQPISFASIVVNGKADDIVADAQGRFAILVPNGDTASYFEVTAVGYETQKIYVATGRVEYNVILKESENNLTPILVIGYHPCVCRKIRKEIVGIEPPRKKVAEDLKKMIRDSANQVSLSIIPKTFTKQATRNSHALSPVAVDKNTVITAKQTPASAEIITIAKPGITVNPSVDFNLPENKPGNKSASLETSLCGRVGGLVVYEKPHKLDTIKTFVSKIFGAANFKIYPNPAQKGSNITVDIKRPGSYSIQLFDNNGKILLVQNFDAAEGATKASVTIPASAAAGMYYIRLFDEENKKQYTDKIIVM
jgi:hypothetical protein